MRKAAAAGFAAAAIIIPLLPLLLQGCGGGAPTHRSLTWTKQYRGISCSPTKGAQNLDDGTDCGIMTLEACQAKCADLPECKAITWGEAAPPSPSGWSPCHSGACCNPSVHPPMECPGQIKCQACGGGPSCQCPKPSHYTTTPALPSTTPSSHMKKCFRHGYLSLSLCEQVAGADTWIAYPPPPNTTAPPDGAAIIVAKGLGIRDYNMVRLSLIRYAGSGATTTSEDVPWDYSAPFRYKWTSNKVSTAVVQVTPGSSQSFTLEGNTIKVKIPKQSEGSVGIFIGDPCIGKATFPCAQSQSWGYKRIFYEVLGQMAVRDELDYVVLLGDLFYDANTNLATKEWFGGLPLEVQSKVLGVTLGNHDFWTAGYPQGHSPSDSLGNAHMQWYAQDTVAAQNKAQPFDFSVDPATKNIAAIENTFWFNMIGNVALVGFANAYSWAESQQYFQQACTWIDSQKPALVVLVGHWNKDNLGCEFATGMDTDDVYTRIQTLPGCTGLGAKLKYFQGHEHVNRVSKQAYGFMVGAFGMDESGDLGFPILDTRNGRAKLYYFNLAVQWQARRASNFDEILGCLSVRGYSKCTQYAEVWLDEPLEPSIEVITELESV